MHEKFNLAEKLNRKKLLNLNFIIFRWIFSASKVKKEILKQAEKIEREEKL